MLQEDNSVNDHMILKADADGFYTKHGYHPGIWIINHRILQQEEQLDGLKSYLCSMTEHYDIVLIGSDRLPSQQNYEDLQLIGLEKRFGVEWMSFKRACQTINLFIHDKRNFLAILAAGERDLRF